eukprot:TRINITY_DN573_c0_g1_i1.p2 TRINITY_DN573_c0_g1~~TRINITY_DN573_c0_g1_i1.p2  ORF type:complete len:282 (+),score=54.55 TRINITY_DN573_c0_g1_i1:3045-3890(+)
MIVDRPVYQGKAGDLNVGRKRQTIKSIAEHLDFDGYWMLDDDLCEFVEFNKIGKKEPSTMGRVLKFCEKVMDTEKSGTTEFQQNNNGFKEFEELLDAIVLGSVLPPEKKSFFLQISKSRERILESWNQPGEILKMTTGTEYEVKFTQIFQKRKLRIAQVGLYRIAGSPFCDIRDQLSTRASHEASTRLYQAVMFDVMATKGIDYMTPQDFFHPEELFKTPEERRDFKLRAKRSGTARWPSDPKHIVDFVGLNLSEERTMLLVDFKMTEDGKSKLVVFYLLA